MKRVNAQILSIPPYISTSWRNINTLNAVEIEGEPVLLVLLHNGTEIKIPHLDPQTVKEIFMYHGKFLEGEADPSSAPKSFEKGGGGNISFAFGLPFKLSGGEGVDGLGSFFQHNPDQKDAQNLPEEVIAKIAAIARTIGMDAFKTQLQPPEPHCNCPYCQIIRAMQTGQEGNEEEEESVSSEDLTFRDWEIEQEGEKLYLVTNPLNKEERYQVFLGNPIGCTCGRKNCEHMRVVLSS